MDTSIFLSKSIVPGCPFTRRLYALTAKTENSGNKVLKSHHHVRITAKNKLDLSVWKHFLVQPMVYCRSFMDFDEKISTLDVGFFTDSSKNPELGCGGYCKKAWFSAKWDKSLLEQVDPSIAYLELYAVTAGILLWVRNFRNKRIIIHCDNQSVVHIVNNLTSGCQNCMVLVRLITLECMVQNVKVIAKYVTSKNNGISDALSRLQFNRFAELTGKLDMNAQSETVLESIWPIRKIWEFN